MVRAARGRGSRNRRAAPSPRAPRRAGFPRSRRSATASQMRRLGARDSDSSSSRRSGKSARENSDTPTTNTAVTEPSSTTAETASTVPPAASRASPRASAQNPTAAATTCRARRPAVAAERVVGGPERELRERGHVAPPRARRGREQDRVREVPVGHLAAERHEPQRVGADQPERGEQRGERRDGEHDPPLVAGASFGSSGRSLHRHGPPSLEEPPGVKSLGRGILKRVWVGPDRCPWRHSPIRPKTSAHDRGD